MERMINVSKWCFNYDSGEYENIERDGFSIDRRKYIYNWDDSEYRQDTASWLVKISKWLFFENISNYTGK